MMWRSWYGSATLITTAGFSARSSWVVAATSSASICAVRILRPCICSISAAIFSQLEIRRLASRTSVNVSESIAHLWATTPPTPPAPMMRTFDMRRASYHTHAARKVVPGG
jgi:hypothetical protein